MSIGRFPRIVDSAPAASDSQQLVSERAFSHFDDALLARSICEGDVVALERLIERYWEPLCSYASRILDDVSLAEDAVQKMFVSLWSDRAAWSPRSVRSYLFRATRNLALDEIRSREARLRREAQVSRDENRQPRRPDVLLEQITLGDAVNDAIQQLPERRREAFALAHLKQLSYAEVASIMGISPKTVGHHVSAALGELRLLLEPVAAEIFGSSTRPDAGATGQGGKMRIAKILP